MRLGPIPFAAAFGAALGPGMMTALPSLSYVVVCIAATTLTSPVYMLAVFAAFACARIAPMIWVGAGACGQAEAETLLGQATRLANRAYVIEIAMLVVVGSLFIQ
jgi:hypothetical protein